MKLNRFFLPTVAAMAISLVGCSHPIQPYYPPPPPPPSNAPVPQLVEMAESNGFRAGVDDGAHDAYTAAGYAPRSNIRFRKAPGYDPNYGPRGPYVQYFRGAYLRGYDKGFYHR
ncbi:hypothetical protein FTO74_08830 [Granulicella sp. WH15]|uniref:hypothetical protein n=1 Tax=Granulicella sp. WH15 TaxID=2602070 RepID=UPI001367129F|nr:hypothetical protein [Granulicella sp. WH15]QHN03460.1 hypothetical protein FTO74_08830 [Granulicella sp. WH15]